MRGTDAGDALAGIKRRRPHPASPQAAGLPGGEGDTDASDGDDPLVMLCVRVPRSLRRRLKLAALRDGASVQELASAAVEAECRRHRV
jgi:hypothetical protein